MTLQIALFEMSYRLSRLETYLYFIALFLFSVFGVDFVYGGELGQMAPNAPYVIAFTMAVITAFFMLVVSLLAGTAVLRDIDQNAAPIFWASPISKREYLSGRFWGALCIIIAVFTALPLGMMASEWLPWRNQEEMAPFRLVNYALPFLFQVVPGLFACSALFFISAAITRKMVVVYTQGIILFVAYLLGVMLTQETASRWLAVLLDPFSFRTSKLVTEFWSVAEINDQLLWPTGLLLFNRLAWVVIGFLILMVGSWRFNYERGNQDTFIPSKLKDFFAGSFYDVTGNSVAVENAFLSDAKLGSLKSINGYTSLSFLANASFYFRSIVSERAFYGIAICGAVIILINSVSLGVAYGVNSLPLTYLIVEDLQETSVYFFLILLVFYAGQLVWRERELQVAQVLDATPVNGLQVVGAKYLGLIMVFVLLLMVLMATGLTFQLLNDFYQFDLPVYAIGFFAEMLNFLGVYTAVALFLQVIVNQKYIAHVLFVLIFIGMQSLAPLGYSHGLFSIGGPGVGVYSEMNGYNNGIVAFKWFGLYWGLFSIVILLLAGAFVFRGHVSGFIERFRNQALPVFRVLLFFSLLALSLCGSYIFYNTNVLNTFWFVSEQEAYRADYEKNLQTFEYRPQLEISSVDLEVELFPKEKRYTVQGVFLLTNTTASTLTDIHLQSRIDENITLSEISLEGGAIIDSSYQEFQYWILHPREPIPPGASLELFFVQEYCSKGFVEKPDTRVVENGIFLTNDHLPTLGYNSKYELTDDAARKSLGLSSARGIAKMDHPVELKRDRRGADANLIEFAATIITDSDQTAIAPGSLVNTWSESGRNHFVYRSEVPIVNFYALLSGRYTCRETYWSGKDDSSEQPVALSIYHHPDHLYNLQRMERGMVQSLNYYQRAFGPYPYDHLRIVEFPRYESFAQSFPGTIPFSEAIGFVMDINDEEDADMVFFITAHEVAHQWWGMQLQAANVEGRHLILESLAQYSALMVFEETYGREKTLQVLRREQEIYLRERKEAGTAERPLVRVDGSDYLYYSKGLVCFYLLRETIGEDKVNRALKCFLADWGVRTNHERERYATAEDLLDYLRAETPDSEQGLITELFELVELQDVEFKE